VDSYRQSEVWTSPGRERLRARSQRTGVEVASVCMASVAGLMTNQAEHHQGVEALSELRRFCDDLGAGVILFPMIKHGGESEEQALQLWRDGFKAAFERTSGCRAKVGMESVGRAGRSADQALAMIEMVGSPDLGVYYDVGNAAYQGFDPVAEMKRLGKHIVQIHIKEIGAQMGEGKLDFPLIFRTIRDIGYHGYLVLETDPGDDPAGSARRNLEFVRRMLY